MSDYITIRETASKWGITSRRVQMMCADGIISGAIKFGKSWAIPKDAKKPEDHRTIQFRSYHVSKGFSLIELIVVISIMAVLSGILTPSLLRYIEKSRESVDSHNIRCLASEINADMILTGGNEDIETAKVVLRQGIDDWQHSVYQDELYKLTDEHDEKPYTGGTAWIEYSASTGLTTLRFGTEADAAINWPSLKNAGAMARAFSLSGKTTIYGGDMSGFSEDEKRLVQELKKKMNWGDGITIHVGNVNAQAGTVMISCVNADLNASDYANNNTWGKQTTATRITFNYNTGEIVRVVEQEGKWGTNNNTDGFWANKDAVVIYSA